MEVVVRRRISLAGAALSAMPLALGVTAATSTAARRSKSKPVTIVCKTEVGVMIAAGDTAVTPPAAQGSEYGRASCGKPLGAGAQSDRFTVPDSGDTLAKFTLYFPSGSLHGTYDLTPQSGDLNFLSVGYRGTVKVDGGTGTFQGMKGTGAMSCKTPDGIHTTCTDKFKLTG
jgi:hypothetical protein